MLFGCFLRRLQPVALLQRNSRTVVDPLAIHLQKVLANHTFAVPAFFLRQPKLLNLRDEIASFPQFCPKADFLVDYLVLLVVIGHRHVLFINDYGLFRLASSEAGHFFKLVKPNTSALPLSLDVVCSCVVCYVDVLSPNQVAHFPVKRLS